MKEMHSLLKRQLKRNAIDPTIITPEFQNFIESVNEAYWEAEDDRNRLERSLELSYQEMLEQYRSVVAQLIQTEKMSSLGRVVAGVAHEVNNPISFISGNLPHIQQYSQDLIQLIRLYNYHHPETTPEIKTRLEDIDLEFLLQDITNLLESMKLGANRISQIVLSLRNFARLDESELKQVDIHEGLESTILLLQHSFYNGHGKPMIQVTRDYSSLPLIECYAGEINQVFMNIISNAIDSLESRYTNDSLELPYADDSVMDPIESYALAMEDQAHYKINIQTSVLENKKIRISIQDNGLGIPEEIANQLFDPFFTTKSVGQGTGLGLAISYQIVVKKHRGNLQCISVPGTGAEFVIEIPLKQQIKQLTKQD